MAGGYTDQPTSDLPAGIVPLRHDSTGLRPDGPAIDVASPSYLTRHSGRALVYAVSEGARSAVTAVHPDPLEIVASLAVPGDHACHLAVTGDGRYLLAAAYGDGTVSSVRLDECGRPVEVADSLTPQGSGPHPRQRGPHAHHIRPLPDGSISVTDLGADLIRRIRIDDSGALREDDPVLRLPPGTGPRQTRLHPNGRTTYVLGELSGELITATNGVVDHRRPAWIDQPDGENLPAHLLVAGDFLYVSHRGHDRIAVFDVGRVVPAPVGEFATGAWPRHMAIHAGWLYIAGQNDNEITVRPLDRTGAVSRTPMCRPSCVLPTPS